MELNINIATYKAPDFEIHSNEIISQAFLDRGILTFKQAAAFIQDLPYGRNANKHDLTTLFIDQCGTCSAAKLTNTKSTTTKMKSNLFYLKKKAILCCISTLFLFSSNLHAQIIYTDITDATPSATYPLDLNNDTIVDFLIQFDLGDKVMCKPQNNNAYSGELAGGMHLPWALSSTVNICDSLITWYGASNPGTIALGTSVGRWVGATNKYLALKLVVGANTYFGWARLDVNGGSTSFTIKDYAYQSTPNACIKSGQTALGILNNNNTQHIFSVFPNPFSSSTILQTTHHLNNATLTISNAFGQTVKLLKNIEGRTITFNRDALPSGIYFIRVEEGSTFVASEKLTILDEY